MKIDTHITEEKARINFSSAGPITEHIPLLTREVEKIVSADLTVESAFSDQAAGQRYWQIDDFARVPCGGAHIERIGEIGLLTLKRKNLGKGMVRIEIALADDLL